MGSSVQSYPKMPFALRVPVPEELASRKNCDSLFIQSGINLGRRHTLGRTYPFHTKRSNSDGWEVCRKVLSENHAVVAYRAQRILCQDRVGQQCEGERRHV